MAQWIKSITNHLYWVVATTDPNSDLRQAKWLSLLDHIADIHTFDKVAYPKCQHDSLDNELDDNGEELPPRAWIYKGMIYTYDILINLYYLTLIIGMLSK